MVQSFQATLLAFCMLKRFKTLAYDAETALSRRMSEFIIVFY